MSSSPLLRAMYDVVMESMSAVGFSEEELDSVLTILAAVLCLGDIVSPQGGFII